MSLEERVRELAHCVRPDNLGLGKPGGPDMARFWPPVVCVIMHHDDLMVKRIVLWPEVEFGVARGSVVDHSLKELVMSCVVCGLWHHIKWAEIAEIVKCHRLSYIW